MLSVGKQEPRFPPSYTETFSVNNDGDITGSSLTFNSDTGSGISSTSDTGRGNEMAVTTAPGSIASNTNCIAGNGTGGIVSSSTPLCSTVYSVTHLTSGTSIGDFSCNGAACPAGLYRITGYASVQTPAAGEIVTYSFSYADGAIPGTTLTLPLVTGSLTMNAGSTGGPTNRLILDGLVLYSDGTQPITYSVVASGSAIWLESVTLEKIQ